MKNKESESDEKTKDYVLGFGIWIITIKFKV